MSDKLQAYLRIMRQFPCPLTQFYLDRVTASGPQETCIWCRRVDDFMESEVSWVCSTECFMYFSALLRHASIAWARVMAGVRLFDPSVLKHVETREPELEMPPPYPMAPEGELAEELGIEVVEAPTLQLRPPGKRPKPLTFDEPNAKTRRVLKQLEWTMN